MRYEKPWKELTDPEKIERLNRDLHNFIEHSNEQVEKRYVAFAALNKAHDAMSVRLGALTAIIGAMCEREAPTERQIIAWSAAIAKYSGDQSQTAIQKMAMDVLGGLSENPSKTKPNSEK